MTKTEILEAIKNGESVWWITDEYVLDVYKPTVIELFYNKEYSYIKDKVVKLFMKNGWWRKYEIDKLYKTKAEAEHYLHHKGITRTEQLPFLTWEEFRKVKKLEFNGLYAGEVCEYRLSANSDFSYIILWEDEDEDTVWECTEENFYKAYDDCVKLFKGE